MVGVVEINSFGSFGDLVDVSQVSIYYINLAVLKNIINLRKFSTVSLSLEYAKP